MTNIITHVTNDVGDYEALYLNGRLVLQHLSISASDFKNITETNQPFTMEHLEVKEEWIDNEISFQYPENLDDIPLDAHSS